MGATETTTAVEPFTVVIHPGTLPDVGRVFCKVSWDGERLRFGGVEGPKANGDARGSSGQIAMGYAHRDPADNDARYGAPTPPEAFTFADGWGAELWLDFLDAWKRWHLNDMSPACEHQRAEGWTELGREEVTLYHWRLGRDAAKYVRDALKAAETVLRSGETVTLPAEVVEIAALPDRVTTTEDVPPGPLYVANGPQYDGDTYNRASERKALGWLRPSEHPRGILTRPCETCGYGYGTAWRSEDVPVDVLRFLRDLPPSTLVPAWV